MKETHDSPACLEFLLNCPCLLDFFLDHCLPRIHSYSYYTLQVFHQNFFLIKSKFFRWLNSVLLFQIAIINHEIIFSVFIFQTIFSYPLSHGHCGCPHSQKWYILGTAYYGKIPWGEYWLSVTRLCRRFTSHSHYLNYQVPLWDLFDTFPWVCPTGFNQCKAYFNVTQQKDISLMIMYIFACLSNDTSTNKYDLHCLIRPHNSQNLWVD